jgi:hypothetical protein
MGIPRHELLGFVLRAFSAAVLAAGLHLFVAGLIVYDVVGPFSRSADESVPVLDLAPLELEMIAVHGDQKTLPSALSDEDLLPLRILEDASRLGHSQEMTRHILRALRDSVLTLWEPARPAGRGHAIVVLDIDSHARVAVAHVRASTGTRDFIGFMEDFAGRLQGLEVPDTNCVSIRVECEFRVEE